MDTEASFDVVVIGGSFAGLSAAMQLGRARRRVCLIDAGRPRNRFAEHSHGFFGRDGARPLEMIAEARMKVLAYPAVAFQEGEVVAARKTAGGFTVVLASGRELQSRKLVLAMGVGDELPELPGLRERWGRTVLHCPYCHGYEFGGKAPLGVLNVHPMSVHQALLIPEWGPTTFFVHGGNEPDADSLRKLQLRGVRIERSPVLALEGEVPALSGVRLADGRRVELAGLYVASRMKLSPLIARLGCELEEGPLGSWVRSDPMTRMTSVPGVYAAGDLSRAMHNATFASADGVQAGVGAHQSLVFEGLN